jgi:hypothetical protein
MFQWHTTTESVLLRTTGLLICAGETRASDPAGRFGGADIKIIGNAAKQGQMAGETPEA